MLRLSQPPTLTKLITSDDVPWIGDPEIEPCLRGILPLDGSQRFCLEALHDTDAFYHDYILTDLDNDGNLDTIDKVISESGWPSLYPFDKCLLPFSVQR